MHTKVGHSMHQVECVFGIYFNDIIGKEIYFLNTKTHSYGYPQN